MSRSSLFLSVGIFALAACQPAADAPEELVAETPPAVADETPEPAMDAAAPTEEPAEIVEAAATADSSESADAVDAAAGDADAADHDDHDGHDHHDGEHDDHDHAEDDHSDHDHDHDHAGGEAHVHGVSDLAVSLDGATVSVSMEGALANFDLDESLREIDDKSTYSDGIVELIGGDCSRDSASVAVRPIGDHGNLMVDLTYTCAAIGDLEAINVIGFQRFAGFETVNAVILTDTGQDAATLSADNTRLDIG